MRNGDVSYWWRARGMPAPRPPLPGGADADVCIVGAGFTGLWTAYYLSRAEPALRVIVLESDFAGFGASGRNGGWVTAALPGSRARYARHPAGRGGVRELERRLREAVDEVGRVCRAEGIDAGYVRGGTLTVATSPAQDARLRRRLEEARCWGDDATIVRYLGREELAGRIRIAGAAGALYWPHCARVQPADLVAGLAEAVTRSGVALYETTPVTSIAAGLARTPAGDVRARFVLRCTEGFTAALPGQRRALLPMNSSMIVTGPLGGAAWETIGWDGRETLGDEAHAYIYAQRTADGRIALGGRGVPYRFGSALDQRGATPPRVVAQLGRILRRMFPAAVEAGIEHAWSGVLGVPRDWCASVTVDAGTGLGWAGGYAGHGVAAANLAGRTLADLVRGVPSPLTALPWVGHRWPRWEPEPARWAGVRGLYALYRAADRLEAAGVSSRTSLLARAGDLLSGIPRSGLQSHQQPSLAEREAGVANSHLTVGSGDHRVLAIHGWFGSARGWGPLPDYLDGAAHTYVFIDLRGYGARRQVSGEYTMTEAAADALTAADELGWQRFSVIGHSMGAKAAHQVLVQAPGRVRALVGINPVPPSPVPFDEQGWALFSGAAGNPANRAAIIDFTTGSRLTRTFIDLVVRHSLDNSAVEAFGAYLPSWAKADLSGQGASDPGVPVKVIAGENDPAMSADVMRQTWLRFFPGAELEVLANAGHYPMFETPVALATSIEEFLRRA
jgi:glycine/D-amino acid oxidase-like deaminating enzyme/pimeloyl-ACP methyl ester carboxylesterase